MNAKHITFNCWDLMLNLFVEKIGREALNRAILFTSAQSTPFISDNRLPSYMLCYTQHSVGF